MQMRAFVAVFGIAILVLSGCGGQGDNMEASATVAPTAEMAVVAEASPTVTEEVMTEEVAAEATATVEIASEEAASEEMATVERPAWQLLPITNAQTGETFTIADFAGKTVYVEPFATWCTSCRQQLNQVKEAQANFGDDVVFLVLSVEPNIGNEALAQYAADHGFDMVFAAMSPEMLSELVAVYGQTLATPPSTPHFVVRADGSTTDLLTGIEDAAAVTSLIQAAQGS